MDWHGTSSGIWTEAKYQNHKCDRKIYHYRNIWFTAVTLLTFEMTDFFLNLFLMFRRFEHELRPQLNASEILKQINYSLLQTGDKDTDRRAEN